VWKEFQSITIGLKRGKEEKQEEEKEEREREKRIEIMKMK
jgi:hypothetical protein